MVSSPLSPFNDRSYYSAHFMDASIWEPFVRQVCHSHSFEYVKVYPGELGTFPTFIVEPSFNRDPTPPKRVVVKFFGPLFKGYDAFHIEVEMGDMLWHHSLPIPSPKILARGQLQEDWWYLVFEFVPGVSIGRVRDELSRQEWSAIARQMGEYMRCLHALSASIRVEEISALNLSVEEYVRHLQLQRERCLVNHQTWKDLPSHLLEQLESFILPVEQLVDFTTPLHLIHADLTADHLIGNLDEGGWHSRAIIDWGDAKAGNILQELVPLTLDLFRVDERLGRECLLAYDLPEFYRQGFPRKALSMVLLDQYPVPEFIFSIHPDTHRLDKLAEGMFTV
ncbi:MAG: hypothetical protein A2136_02440 [Chloroflexi bacterium RBG_16_54_11]|nr:MAG: hypothetical protein A2136_02440 [Chloroflexi bacterium RBG_16_54_11]